MVGIATTALHLESQAPPCAPGPWVEWLAISPRIGHSHRSTGIVGAEHMAAVNAAQAQTTVVVNLGPATGLLRSAMTQCSLPVLAAALKRTMLSLDPTFQERDYGCRNFREFLTLMTDQVSTEPGEYDLLVNSRHGDQPMMSTPSADPVAAAPGLLMTLRGQGLDLPLRPETRDALLVSVHDAWREGRLATVGDIGGVLRDEETGLVPNKGTIRSLTTALTLGDAVPPRLTPLYGGDVLRCPEPVIIPYDKSLSAEWAFAAHVTWLTWVMRQLPEHGSLDRAMVETFFTDAATYGVELVAHARHALSIIAARDPS